MLLSAHGIEGLQVVSTKGKPIGVVSRALFDTSAPKAVGFEVQPPRLAYVVDRKPRYLALDSVTITNDGIAVREPEKDAWGKRAAKRLGFGDWERSVQWRHMPVASESGRSLGSVKDVVFTEGGEVRSLELSGGVTADVALGIREIEGADVVGFDGEVVRVSDAAGAAEYDGGVAAMAGRGTAIAGDAAGKAAVAAGKAAGTAVAYGKSAAKVASETETGKKAMDWLKKAGAATLDAMKAPEDDDE